MNLPLLVSLPSNCLLASIWRNSPYPLTANRIALSVNMAFLKPPFLTLRSTSIELPYSGLAAEASHNIPLQTTSDVIEKQGRCRSSSQQLNLSLFNCKISITRNTVLTALQHFCIATTALDKISLPEQMMHDRACIINKIQAYKMSKQ